MQSTVDIFGIEYDVEKVDKIDDDGRLGEVNSDECVIRILASLKPDKLRQIIIHEVLHAISDELDLGLTENQVMGASVGICAILKANNILLDHPLLS